MKEIKSQYESIVQEDFNQFREISRKFMNVKPEDVATLYDIAIESWLLATRWSEIQSNASKMALDYDFNKTEFREYCYQKYRQLQEMHITARSWYRLGLEDKRANDYIGE